MSKEQKNDVKVQKETATRTVDFRPKVLHRVKGSKEFRSGYIDSFKRIFQSKIFQKEKAKYAQSQLKSNQSQKEENQTINSQQSNQKSTDLPEIQSEHNSRRQSSLSMKSEKTPTVQTEGQNKSPSKLEQRQCTEEEYNSLIKSQYLRIKYVQKISSDCVLIGNENQVDLFQFKIQKSLPSQAKKWSIHLNKPIQGVAVSKLAESKILLWTDTQLFIYEWNVKNVGQQPNLIQKLAVESQNIISVLFLKRNIFLVCCRSHIQIYQITEVNKYLTIARLEIKRFKCPEHFEVLEVPEHCGNNIKIFYANMRECEYDEDGNFQRVKSREKAKDRSRSKDKPESKAPNHSKQPRKRDIFGLYYVEIQYDYNSTKVNQMKKVYEIKKSLRSEIKLMNVTSTIFFMNLKTEVLAVKNGLIIDSVGVNFKFDHCYLNVVRKDLLVHILEDKIEFYRLELNFNVMPEKIQVTPFDSIYFPRDLNDEFLALVPVNEGYGIFFQKDNRSFPMNQLAKGLVQYWYGLTFPVPLGVKLNEIFPSTQKIEQTSFETLQTLCDMAGKMGVTTAESYRYLWRKSKKQTQKDYQILLQSRDYGIIQQEITSLLKKRAEKLRMLSKNQQICIEFLRPRIFQYNCSIRNLQEYCEGHFFNGKLNAFKDIEVERKRFELDMYKKAKKTGVETMKKVMQMFQVQELKDEEKEDSEFRIKQPSPPKEIMAFEQQQSQIISSQDLSQQMQEFDLLEIKLPSQKQASNTLSIQKSTNLFNLFLKSSKNYSQIIKDRKTAQAREKEKIRHEIESKMELPADYNEIKITIKDLYLWRDSNVKQYFLEIVAQIMAKQHTPNDHLKYYALRVLVRNFKLLFRDMYEGILVQMIDTYKHKISRLIENFLELLPYEYSDQQFLPLHTDQSLCQCIWNSIQSQEIEESLFLSDITTIENREKIEQFRNSLWYKRNFLSHHGVVTFTKEELRAKYSEDNMPNIKGHYFYLFLSKFLEIKRGLIKEISQVSQPLNKRQSRMVFNVQIATLGKQDPLDKKVDESRQRVDKQMLRTNQLLKRVEQIYPLMPEHLKGYLNLYFELYNFLEGFSLDEREYSSMYEFLRLRDFELFSIFFRIQKKTKGFLLKQVLKKYQDPALIDNGKEKFILGIQHYFDSQLSEITDLKTILNRLNGQSREFHIKFEGLYDCLLSAIMKKIRISQEVDIKLDELLIYVQNIPFSTENGRIFEKLLLIQEVHLEMQTLKRARINMTILEIKDNPQIVIAALVESELRRNKLIPDYGYKEYTAAMQLTQEEEQPISSSESLSPPKIQSKELIEHIIKNIDKISLTDIQSVEQLKMYFWKCISELQCIKRHFYDDSVEHLLEFVFVTELLRNDKLVVFIGQALEDDDIQEMLELRDGMDLKRFKKSVVYYCYKQRLSKHNKSYLESQLYLNQLLTYLPYNDGERMLIEEEIKYCHLFQKCEYEIPYPLTVIREIPVLDEIEYHISQIKSQKIDQLDVGALFASMQAMRELVEPTVNLTQKSLTQRVRQFERILYEFVFFKYLREKKLKLALDMAGKLISLNPTENCMIYNVFIIDSMLQQFNDLTGDLLISLVSYYYHDVEELRLLLDEMISKPFTTTLFEAYLRQKIERKIKQGNISYFDKDNFIFSQEVKELLKKLQSQTSSDISGHGSFIKLCQLLDATFHHMAKSSSYIQQNKYFQLLYRIMLFNPYQVAYFIYNKPEINLKAMRAFLTFMSQEIVFDAQMVLKAGSMLFVIILDKIRDGFLIGQQIKEYQKLNLKSESIDENKFMQKYSEKTSLTEEEKLLFESYTTMRQKLQGLQKYKISQRMRRELNRVKKYYDSNSFIVKKHIIDAEVKFGSSKYLVFDKWSLKESKLEYYLDNRNEFAAYEGFVYLFASIDKDDSYVTKGIEEFTCPKVRSWPTQIKFNKVINRRKILLQGENTRIPNQQSDINQMQQISSRRDRKPSAYLPEEFKLHKKSTTDLKKQFTFSQKDDEDCLAPHTPIFNANFLGVIQPHKSPKASNNPILNFFSMGGSSQLMNMH